MISAGRPSKTWGTKARQIGRRVYLDEKTDQVRRRVTLDTQFRMHPVLGEFVSHTFYERHGGVRIQSGVTAATLGHSLPDYRVRKDGDAMGPRPGAVACFIDVPGGPGRREQRGPRRSLQRVIEARQVAREVEAALRADERLTVGVIAFYRDQVTSILRELEPSGLAARSSRGELVLTDAASRRLQVGTVDAFQGKEFDIVFLSITRSNEHHAQDEPGQRIRYGHLLLENRLCVAMSRQKRLLVAVGDLAFIREAKSLEAFQAFIRLCEGHHGCIR